MPTQYWGLQIFSIAPNANFIDPFPLWNHAYALYTQELEIIPPKGENRTNSGFQIIVPRHFSVLSRIHPGFNGNTLWEVDIELTPLEEEGPNERFNVTVILKNNTDSVIGLDPETLVATIDFIQIGPEPEEPMDTEEPTVRIRRGG